MAKFKNALRQHLIAPVDPETADTQPAEEAYLPLERFISNIEANNTSETEDVAYYHGDGTPETNVISVAKGYNVTGLRYYGDPAQDLIASLEGKVGSATKIWHRIIRADGEKQYDGKATVTEIVTDGGEASADEAFSCTITYDQFPVETEVVPGT